ncbi:hypothetical protein [Roseovarius sp. MMSF_3281]|uniref:hypothetical protein n=1 Tax=Roseovarius sp. MMSF_3281 TaxID=3046694 RepID=UPI00273D3228|nr:hypothetical protein [Roseovarius sp. MMSF_3281]
MKRLACLLLLIPLIAGCTTPYDPPDVVGEQVFPGAMTLATQSKTNRVRVVMAHGMCSGFHKYYGANNWVAKRAGLIAEAIGNTSFAPRDYTPTKEYPDIPGQQSAVQRIDMTMQGQGGVTYDMSFLLWGETFDKARDEIDSVQIADSTGKLPQRGTLNATLKDNLMNECFVDAVAYTGPRGDVVRKNMRQALCELMGGRISGRNTGRSSETVKCLGLSGASDTPVMLVPESLGAKVVLDAFLALDDGAGGTRKARALGPVKAIHLATHQLPLLDTALAPDDATRTTRNQRAYQTANLAAQQAAPPEVSNQLDDFLQVLNAARNTRRDSGPLSLVVYYDPNDMFGYPLTTSYLGPRLDVALTNVIVSNAPTYAGLASNPLESHRNTARPGIAKIIVQGSDALAP